MLRALSSAIIAIEAELAALKNQVRSTAGLYSRLCVARPVPPIGMPSAAEFAPGVFLWHTWQNAVLQEENEQLRDFNAMLQQTMINNN